MKSHSVVTRIAPSPTGLLHIGTARTALFNFLFAKQKKGKFLLRFEDTDRKRSAPEFEKDILEGLTWLSLIPDEVSRQSERADLYEEYIKKLLSSDRAYLSREESKESPGTTVELVRLRNQNKIVVFSDIVHGDIRFDTTELGDFVIARGMRDPLFHLAVVVDDYEMKVSHVIRGEDLISTTPRQILIQEALGLPRPSYTHIPLILAPDRSKLSKRHGATSLSEYRRLGYLPQALVNYLALLGWNQGGEQEFFTLAELTQCFTLEGIHRSAAVFNIEKLNWFNSEYIKKLAPQDLQPMIRGYLPEFLTQLPGWDEKIFGRLVGTLQERIRKLSDIRELAEHSELTFYFAEPSYTTRDLLWKVEREPEEVAQYLDQLVKKLDQVGPEAGPEEIRKAIWPYAEEKGRGNVLWPMRYSLSGKKESPDPFTLVYILGKDESRRRLEKASRFLRSS